MSNPAHIELVLSEKEESVKKGEEDEEAKPRLTRKQQARLRIKAGGGTD